MRTYRYFRNWVDRFFSDEESFLLVLLLSGALLAVIFFGATLAPLVAAAVFSFLLQGVVAICMRFSLSRTLSVHMAFVIFLGIVTALLLFLLPLIGRQIGNFINAIPNLMGRLQVMLNDLPERYPSLISESQIQSGVGLIATQLQESGQWLLTSSLNFLPNLLNIVIYLVLVPILVYFLLRDGDMLMDFVKSLLPKKRNLITRVGREMHMQIANYLRGKAVEILLVSTVTYFCFLAFDLNYSLLLAVLVGLSVLVPFVGATIVTLPVAAVALLQWGWSADAAWLLTVYGLIQLLDGNVLVPLLFSEAVNLHPVSIILSVLIFGGIWGVWGVFFAIPLATLVKAIYQAWPERAPEEEASVPG